MKQDGSFVIFDSLKSNAIPFFTKWMYCVQTAGKSGSNQTSIYFRFLGITRLSTTCLIRLKPIFISRSVYDAVSPRQDMMGVSLNTGFVRAEHILMGGALLTMNFCTLMGKVAE